MKITKQPRTATDIWKVLEQIGHAWEQFPEQRLGALFYQVARGPSELYVLTDTELVERIQQLLEKEE